MKKIDLPHVVLYAKGWYTRTTEKVFDDLRKCLTCDGYSAEFFTDSDIVTKLLHEIEKLPNFSVAEFFNEIKEKNSWKYGYYTSENTKLFPIRKPSDDKIYNQDEAVVFYCLSCFCNSEIQYYVITRPDFEKCLPRNEHVDDESMKRIFGDLKVGEFRNK